MYIHPEDFGQGPVTLLGNEVLFLDSNVLVAFLDEGHIFHRSAYTFLTYLTLNDVPLAIAETTVNEVVFILSILHYNNLPTDSRRLLWKEFTKNNSPLLIQVQEDARDDFEQILPLLQYCASNEREDLPMVMAHLSDPLVTADAILLSIAERNCTGFISLDRDFSRANSALTLYNTKVKNENFDSETVLQRYGLKEFLVSYLGEDKFYDKYGYIPKLGG